MVAEGWGTRLIAGYLSLDDGELDLQPDGRVLVFGMGASVITGLLFELLPAWRLSGSSLAGAAKDASAGARSRLHRGLIMAQIALSVALLAKARLFVRSLQNLKATDLGFLPERRVSFWAAGVRTTASGGDQPGTGASLFGTANPIGRAVRFGTDANQPLLEIISVAKDVKYRNQREKPAVALYVPYYGGVLVVPMIVRVALRAE